MQQTLLRIPLHGPWSLGPLGQVPGFGFGIVLLLWLVGGIVWFSLRIKKGGVRAELTGPLVTWLVVAVVIVLIPRWAQHKFDRQIAELSSMIARQPQAAEAYLQRGSAFAEKLAFDNAIQDYRRAIDLDADLAAAHARLAWLRATCPQDGYRDADEALQHARRACALTAYARATALDTLAAACAEQGDFAAAVTWEQKAARSAYAALEPEERLRLGAIRKRLGTFLKHEPFRSRYGTSVPVFGYGFMLFVGFVVAGSVAARRAQREGLGTQLVWDLAIWLFIAGIAGARLFYLIQKRHEVFADAESLGDYVFATINLREGGLVFYGSLLGGIAAYVAFCWRRKLDPLHLSDVLVPAIFVGLALGRIGCFLNGCCFGHTSSLPWSVTFPLGSVPDMILVQRKLVLPDALATLPLHPTQIYSSLNGLMLAFLTAVYFPRRACNGAVTALALVAYAVTRFVIEILRGDELGQFGTSLTISQWVSMGVALCGVGLGCWCWLRRGKQTPTPA